MENILTYECVFGVAYVLLALASGRTTFTLLDLVMMVAASMSGKLVILFLQRPLKKEAASAPL